MAQLYKHLLSLSTVERILRCVQSQSKHFRAKEGQILKALFCSGMHLQKSFQQKVSEFKIVHILNKKISSHKLFHKSTSLEATETCTHVQNLNTKINWGALRPYSKKTTATALKLET